MSAFPTALAGPAHRGGSLSGLVGIMYLRASQDRSGRSISVSSQYDEGLEFFEEYGITLHAVYSDNNLSGSVFATEGRDDYEQALDDLRTGRAQLLWTFDHSRAQRNLEVYTRLRRICIESGALWAYGGRVYDMTDPKDRRDTARDAVDAEGTADNISIHTRRGIRARAKRGEHAGKPAYGYRAVYCPETGRSLGWVQVEEEAEVIRRIVDWCLERKTLTWIARKLDSEGVPCPQDRRWDKRLVAKLVEEQRHEREWNAFLDGLSPEEQDWASTIVARVNSGETPKEIARELNRNGVKYFRPSRWNASKVKNIALSLPAAGLRRHHGEVVMQRVSDPNSPEGYRLEPVKVTWQRIKTPEQHARLVALLNDPKRKTRRDGVKVKHRWSGIAVCGVCGSRTSAVKSSKGKPVYRCYDKSCVQRDQILVDAYLTEQAIQMLEREDAAQIFRLDLDMSEARAAQKDAEELRARLDSFRAKAAEGKIVAESYAFIEADLLPKIEKADAKAKRATLPPILADVVGMKARKAFLALDLAQQREICRAIMRPKILPTKRKVPGRLDTDAVESGFLYSPQPEAPAPKPDDELNTAA